GRRRAGERRVWLQQPRRCNLGNHRRRVPEDLGDRLSEATSLLDRLTVPTFSAQRDRYSNAKIIVRLAHSRFLALASPLPDQQKGEVYLQGVSNGNAISGSVSATGGKRIRVGEQQDESRSGHAGGTLGYR